MRILGMDDTLLNEKNLLEIGKLGKAFKIWKVSSRLSVSNLHGCIKLIWEKYELESGEISRDGSAMFKRFKIGRVAD